MPRNITQYNLLISCPSDVVDEIEIIEEIVKDFNLAYNDVLGLSILVRHWANSSYPESGGKPQALLNKQFIEDCDAAVAIFWTRFGTPTDDYGSGTEEEIEIMIEAGKQVFIYFSDTPVPPSKVDKDQRDRIEAFKGRYKDRGIFWTYSGVDEFRKLFKAHLDFHFLTAKRVTEMSSEKRPDFTLSLIGTESDAPISGKFAYEPPTGAIYRRELSEEDIEEDIADTVTIEDINRYNDELPSVEEVDEYNAKMKLYENAQNNCLNMRIEIENTGKTVGRNIHVDVYFPDGVLVYKDYLVEDISEPRDVPVMPKNPVEEAYEELYKTSMRRLIKPFMTQMEWLDRHSQAMFGMSAMTGLSPNGFSRARIEAVLYPKSYNYSIDNHSRIFIHFDDLLHTRRYVSDNISMIFTSSGKFVIDYEIMCEELEEPIGGSVEIIVERS